METLFLTLFFGVSSLSLLKGVYGTLERKGVLFGLHNLAKAIMA